MAIQVQLRRGTTAQHASFTGAAGEVTYDSDKKTLRAHDGSTAGGSILTVAADLTTANVSEVTNLYYTVSRANTAIDDRVTKAFVDNLGVDAATLDGIDSTAFALDTDLTTANVSETTNLYFTFDRARSALVGNSVSVGELTVSGNLFVEGDTVQINTATLTVEDKNILLANGAASAEVADGAGITVDGAQANIIYSSSNDRWSFNKTIEVNGEPVITFNDVFAIDAGESVTIAYTDGSTSESVFSAEQGQASISIIDSNTPGAKLQLNLSNVVINNGQGANPIDLEVSGGVSAGGTITSPFFYSESDSTLKDNIEPITNALDVIKGINGVKYVWKRSQAPGVGVIAQDVEKVLPEIVAINNAGSKTVSYDSLVAVLIEAVKEQQKQIEELKAKIK